MTDPALPPRYADAVRVGSGGMSDVFRATDTTLGRTVAVKLLAQRFGDDSDARHRFAREGRAAARLSDDQQTVTVFDVGEWRGRPFIVMEYLAGGSIEDVLQRNSRPPLELTLSWLRQAAHALDHAHSHGVVHRDVKPANLLLDDRSDLYVADFGIASAAGVASVTVTGTVLGTAGYLAPEQAAGRPATPASDRYGLAIVAYELLTGTRPFEQSSPVAEALAKSAAAVPPASLRNRVLPAAVDPVFERAFSSDPADRHPSCTAFVEALAEATTTAAWPVRDDLAPTVALQPARRRRRSGLIVTTAVLALAGALAAIGLTEGHGTAAPPETVTLRVTAPARTVEQAPVTAPATTIPSDSGAIRQGEALLQHGRYLEALPFLQQANRQLNGSGTPGEARADTDLAADIVQVGSCNGVVSLVDRADQIVGATPQTAQLRAACTGPPGQRPDHRKGKDQGSEGG